MPESNPLCGLLHCQHPLDPAQTDVQFVSPSDSHYELMEIARQLEGIRLVLEAAHGASQQLQAQAQSYLQEQKRHAESFLGRLDTPDYYPFIALPQGTTATDLPDGGRQFVLPGGIILLVRADHSVVAVHDGRTVNVEISLGGTVVLPNGQAYQVHQDYLAVTQSAAGIEGLPPGLQPVCLGRGRYRVVFADGVILTVWHALPADDVHPAQECMLHVANPTGGLFAVSRKGIRGIGLEVQVRLLADGALGFRVLPDGNPDALQYLHAGTARSVQGVVELALSNGAAVTYRCGRSGGEGNGNGSGNGGSGGDAGDGHAPVTFHCEERGQCSI